MPTLTVELPETECHAALALSESERNRVAANASAAARNIPQSDDPTTEEDIAAIRECFAQLEGRFGERFNLTLFGTAQHARCRWRGKPTRTCSIAVG